MEAKSHTNLLFNVAPNKPTKLSKLERIDRIFDELESGRVLSKADLTFLNELTEQRPYLWAGFDLPDGLERAYVRMQDVGLENIDTGKDKAKAKTQVNLGKKSTPIKMPKPKTKVKLG